MNSKEKLLHFNRKERIILFLMIFCLTANVIFQSIIRIPSTSEDTSYDLSEILVKLESEYSKDKSKTRSTIPETSKKVERSYQSQKTATMKQSKTFTKPLNLSVFDPNQVTLESLLDMDLPEKWCNTFMNYRNAGGKFYKPEDMKSVYGTSEKLYDQIVPFVKINEHLTKPKKKNKVKSKPPIQMIDINTADASELIALKGIGETLSQRIVKYRDILGGYYNPDQLKEVYGLTAETFNQIHPYLKVNSATVKLNLNFATEDEIAKHPYISKKQAKIIVNFRRNNGPFSKIENLAHTKVFSDKELKKLLPYLTV